eukprot:CAMPEP_0170489042 /NCGR_PEP_ID=MMETSP0208-20121228/7457_1 /TAXON_ID=197538 /ORGANISM="Strombidium inclinatum, Strain S3" /LENGTH=162 /DNA_ID=CAMNT_0010763801 /DNA_START=354 /DNA_END=842 /DNA_ORIENTATION=-
MADVALFGWDFFDRTKATRVKQPDVEESAFVSLQVFQVDEASSVVDVEVGLADLLDQLQRTGRHGHLFPAHIPHGLDSLSSVQEGVVPALLHALHELLVHPVLGQVGRRLQELSYGLLVVVRAQLKQRVKFVVDHHAVVSDLASARYLEHIEAGAADPRVSF